MRWKKKMMDFSIFQFSIPIPIPDTSHDVSQDINHVVSIDSQMNSMDSDDNN